VTFDVVEHLDHPGGVRGGDDHTDESTAVEVEVTDFCHRHLEPAADLRNDGAYGGAFGLPGTHCPEEDVELDRRIPHCSSMSESLYFQAEGRRLLDTNLPRKTIFMRLPATALAHVPGPALPPGYRFDTYAHGRCADWARVETRVGEFASTEAAVEYFRLVFLAHPDLARERVQFIFNPVGVAVATASAWFGYSGDGTPVAPSHWFAVGAD